MKTVKIINFVVLAVAVIMIATALCMTLFERDVPYDSVGALYHAKVELTAMLHFFVGGCLLLADGVFMLVRYIFFKKRR